MSGEILCQKAEGHYRKEKVEGAIGLKKVLFKDHSLNGDSL